MEHNSSVFYAKKLVLKKWSNFSLFQITFDEVLDFMESKGVDLQARFHGYARREIETFRDFISTIGVIERKNTLRSTSLTLNCTIIFVSDLLLEY